MGDIPCNLTLPNAKVIKDDVKELQLYEGINVWSTNQEVLENQALRELEIFSAEQSKSKNETIEEGEIVEGSSNKEKLENNGLDIKSYFKRQEELKKIQEHKKSLSVSSNSLIIGNKVSNSINKNKNRKHKNIVKKSAEQKSVAHNEKNDINDLEENSTSKVKSIGVRKRKLQNLEDKSQKNSLEFIDDVSENEENSGSEYVPSDCEDSDYEPLASETVQNQTKPKKRRITNTLLVPKVKDDGLPQCYKTRLDLYYKKLENDLALKQATNNSDEEDQEEEYYLINGGLKVPWKTWNDLYSFQRDSLKWLWNLHQKQTGGLLGDEMGLGKTVQIIAFLNSLEFSKVQSFHGRFTGLGPSIIVCPATVIHQWVKHFHEWSPEFRVGVLHQSGCFQGNKAELIRDMHKNKGIIVTTYLGILKYKGNLLDYNWHYIILDEGHKIRNPTAKITVALKTLRTPHRIMLTGSPMQNNLTELWSLFDYTNPGMLGNLTTFQEHFANPILHGGFANSTPMQEATALSVATTLKTVISPFLLRRTKNEVQHHISLPNKSEQVLFCSLTEEQRDLYKGFLMSEHVNMILGRGVKNWFSENHMRSNVLVAITKLRKICNHPDIYLTEAGEEIEDNESTPIEERFGYYKRSGKMVVVSALLKIWKKQGHRVLLFTQGRAMISIFQEFLRLQGYKFLKMDGSTSISSRQPLINKFNEDTSYDVFLLTTRVGGLGVNLTGANRVVIYDPDWNPATDTQARERAWRIGQEKEVTIYRLLSAGTIEEKMYQRQIWKQLLSNKVLLDPQTNRFFKSSDLHDLFSLQESTDSNPETANIFHNSRVRIQEKIKEKQKNKLKKSPKNEEKEVSTEASFTEDKIQAMRNLAQQIAKSLSKTDNENSKVVQMSYQLELAEERKKKLEEKDILKKFSAQELLLYNKKKSIEKIEDENVNKIDDREANVGFDKALEYSEKTAKLHHVLNAKLKTPEEILEKAESLKKVVTIKEKEEKDLLTRIEEKIGKRKLKNSKNHKKDKEKKKFVDDFGTVDGEEIQGLVRTEKKRRRTERQTNSNESQDDFVLGKLFSKKGVSGALKHESILQSGSQGGNLRIHTEARMRAEKSLEALRKSRIDNWRW